MADVTMTTIYRELKSLKKDMEIVKCALIEEEKVSARELKEFKVIKREMENGKEKSFEDVFGK